MKIKIPAQIKIGAHNYRVVFDSFLWKEEALKGSTNHLRQLIKLDNQIPDSQRAVTFLHEVIHNICEVYNVLINDGDVDRIAQGMGEFLLNNLNIEFDWSDIEEVEK